MTRAVNVRSQIRKYMIRFGLKLRSSNDIDAIRKSVIYGFFANCAKLQNDGTYVSIRGGQSLRYSQIKILFVLSYIVQKSVHPHSGLFKGALPPWVIYSELIFTSKAFMNDVTPIDPKWLTEIVPSFYKFVDK